MAASFRFYAGLFLVTACTLMLQVIQTRILSVLAWYHLAFFAISMAMFGLTAGAVWVYLHRKRFTPKTFSYDLAHYSAAFALAIAVCLAVQMTLAPIVSRSFTSIWTWLELALCLAIPFFFSGVVVSLALTRSPFPVGRVYGVDLFGAAVGCLGVLLLLNCTDGPSAVLWTATAAAAAALLFSTSGLGEAPAVRPPLSGLMERRRTIFAVLGVCAFLNGLSDYGLQPLVAKGRFENGESHIFRKWNSFSRIAVYPTTRSRPYLWGPSPRFANDDTVIEQRFLNIDGDAGTVAYRFNGDLKEAEFLKSDLTNLAHYLPGRERVAVIGVGGGRDVLSAAVFGSRDITAVELNPVFVELLTERPGFADFSRLNQLKGVNFVVDEGRSWFARTERSFDLIQMSLIDTWAATGAGAFSLSENGLYTVEAWKIFLKRLTPQGVYSVSRWYSPKDPSETGRMLSLATAALLELGVAEPRQHLFLATQGNIATLIVAKEPLSASGLAALRKAVDFHGYQVLVSPDALPSEPILRPIVTARNRADLEDYTSRQTFDLTPATDDRPFFFNQLPVNKPIRALYVARKLVSHDPLLGGVRSGNLVATATLLILFLVSLALVLAAIVIPLRSAIADSGTRLVTGGTFYFLLIGIGFMTVEIGLLQRMSVFLGHPTYSLSISLFTLILATGGGSLLSDRWTPRRGWPFALWAAATGGYLMTLPHWLPAVVGTFDGAPLAVRAAVCVLVIAPAGLLMGFAFPMGMRLVAAVDARPTPWFWGINGAAGVLASVVAVGTSIALGIGATLTLGALCYFLLIPVALVGLRAPDPQPNQDGWPRSEAVAE
ncbi:hypothetical protein [Candidatus Methylocalor cossyra]|uniref:Spermidine synthase n=1 Tax=Candidatus Methylocalor cossyra TaxID=3108543 RepID=A0ABM9NIN4_9GAMM